MVCGAVFGRDTSQKVADWDGVPRLVESPAPPPPTAVRYLPSGVRKRTTLSLTPVGWQVPPMHSHQGPHGGQHVMDMGTLCSHERQAR